MTLELEPRHRSTLLEVLESYLSDLRYEIANTDSMTFRDGLKEKKAVLMEIVAMLEAHEDGAREERGPC